MSRVLPPFARSAIDRGSQGVPRGHSGPCWNDIQGPVRDRDFLRSKRIVLDFPLDPLTRTMCLGETVAPFCGTEARNYEIQFRVHSASILFHHTRHRFPAAPIARVELTEPNPSGKLVPEDIVVLPEPAGEEANQQDSSPDLKNVLKDGAVAGVNPHNGIFLNAPVPHRENEVTVITETHKVHILNGEAVITVPPAREFPQGLGGSGSGLIGYGHLDNFEPTNKEAENADDN